ncbi:MAG: transcriptional regulator [Gammaproteobacteria bacterium RIFCSPLOWO2_02_FULL_42_14]|nr:MAG: transcriptional regulator [Gammaproteobacteria bacterium RIFCSPHIGHO2_02_FULL_42_43]OGT29175.1 MAG: transcriptional regulator [Gammaproteobacteria bacterium RIFCSPHIGHO2_01_FULL_42_8]OGT51168.1 MAG: transcriptional regulator [Gammaproteobacteria bacterium RIFCSPHIGHO2_12_FULL_41_25]OGT62930.1 MAG: transcriptional regulator [Gammaproteobacteria bacterium RIFCSPLOWO2_02_FULL_42_14]OGT86062.1 MAG: transcriptional regulator [Gammaproteobacteria bacterium RIFCSPLOWO2_12_FULL_42_18]
MDRESEFAPIPDKLYFSIGEVAELCQLKPHVLRYWEQEFPQLTPSKRRGNRRYYQRKDVILIREIKQLLYTKGYTIDGARTHLQGDESRSQQKIQNSHVLLQSAITQLETLAAELET